MLVVYSAVFGDIGDVIRPVPEHAQSDVQYVLFSDRTRNAAGWDVRSPAEAPSELSSRRLARWHKLFPHRLFPEATESIWIDGAFSVKKHPADLLQFLSAGDLAVCRHRDRDCIYQEFRACHRLRKDDPLIMLEQERRYQTAGFPKSAGLAETGILLRRHSATYEKLADLWWQEIYNFSVRDQLSFPVCCSALSFRYREFPWTVYKSPYFEWHGHR